ncbi:MAG: Co2+/Mg2+ efflux protein ApaG [Flavobacteriales bacterium]|nr:Co2+/Mg2+ efflux protein ApaG [Flavobacteriales bacterium]
MVTDISAGVLVSVQMHYEDDLSNPANRHFIYSYKIRLENKNEFPVQLLRRHWYIQDSLGYPREVEGEGVVGQQPHLLPGDSYEYESACNLASDFGLMFGTYLFKNMVDGTLFQVQIPKFQLFTPDRLN